MTTVSPISPSRTAPMSTRSVNGPVILLELNELSPALMDTFIAQGHLPNFKRLRDGSQIFITDAEEVNPTLDPWIQWVTAHSGLSFDEHGIHHLGDGHKLAVKSVWDFASEAGKTVWVCGSMNIKYDLPIRGAVVPDPWSVGAKPFPDELALYHKFVQRNVQEYTNENLRLSMSDYRRFLQFMMAHGLSPHTLVSIIRQLASEKVSGGKGHWKRATILDKLQRDVFLHYLKTLKPSFATFFLNSTAHFQHTHWRNMDPEPFKIKPTDSDQAEYQHAVRYGYVEMDKLVGDIVRAAPKDAVIILATALSQQPCLLYEDIGGKTFYRPRVFDQLVEFAGVKNCRGVEPVMSEQFHLRFDSVADANAAAALLEKLSVDGKEAMLAEVRETNVFAGCKIFSQVDKDAVLSSGPGSPSIGFYRIFYQVESLKSGMHHPDGMFWINVPGTKPSRHPATVSLRDVAPTLLGLLGIEKPDYMTGVVLPVQTPAATS